jgi:cation diffusion facilitator CzcD-associated flavoprotein CzcO
MEELVIIGSGPYGLSVAAHLRAGGRPVRVFGEAMGFWENQMPRGMLVRSAWEASSISDPEGSLCLDVFEAEQPQPFSRPMPGEELARYGRWFQTRAIPDLDTRRVSAVERADDGFALTLEDGERIDARRVVIATGLRGFDHRPPEFAPLGDDLATHSVDMQEPSRFAGKSVAVIGTGQSAVESAALLHEAGADVELIGRAPLIRWLVRGERLRSLDPIVRRVLYAPTDVGPAGLSWIVAMPNLFRRLPIRTQERLAYRSIRPAATGWLMDRTSDIRWSLQRRVTEARPDAGRASLALDDGSTRHVDHVLLATGYRIDAGRHPLLGESIRKRLRLHEGYPVLGRGFESSVPGLHFVGAFSAWSFGPVMRFVAGTKFTGHAIARHLKGAPSLGERFADDAQRQPDAVAQSPTSG